MKIVPFFSLMFLLFMISCTDKNEGIKPQYRDVTEAVYSTATVHPRYSYKVFPKVGGIIEQLMVEEGDEIKKGDLILSIADNQSNVNIKSAQLSYEIARESYNGESAILKEIKEQIKTARIRVENDSINFERQQRLWLQNVGSKQEYESRKLAFEIAKNDMVRLVNSYERNRKELQRQMEIARNNLQIKKLNKEDYNVRSKIDGKVYSIEKEIGESISSQTAVAIIGSKDDFILNLLIDEVDIQKVFEGQTVVVALDAYPNMTFEAKISKIYPEKDERSLTFKVEADFVTKPIRLLKGLSGEANIIISKKNNVLTLPSQYITEDKKVQTNNGLKPIETGLQSLEYTEIISGIDSSTLIKLSQ